MKKFKIGLVLSGGGAKGIAHLGALKALEEKGIKPGIISGVSAGAVMGALYASGQKPEQIHKVLRNRDMWNFSKLNFPKLGLFNFTGLKQDLTELLPVKTFEELDFPLIVVATNLNKGIMEYFDSGDLVQPIIASSSIPLLYKPLKIGDYYYVDGGVFRNLPVDPIRKISKTVIGMHVNPIQETNELYSVFNISSRVFQLTVNSSINESKKACDIFVQPPELYKYSLFDNRYPDQVFELGYREMKNVLEKKKIFSKGSWLKLEKFRSIYSFFSHNAY